MVPPINAEDFDMKQGNHLSEEVIEYAKNKLREEETTKKQSLEQFRNWISKNGDLEGIRTDENFLLRFLRTKKFSLPMAQDMLLKYLNLRQTYRYLAYNLDYLEPNVLELIDSGYLFPSPVKDKHGRTVIIGNSKALDPHKYTHVEMTKVHGITYEALLEDENNQILGFTHFGDIKDVSPAHLMIWSPLEFPRAFKWAEHSMPMRHMEIHLMNLPTPVKYAYDIFKALLNPKIRERVHLHESLDELHSKLDRRALPKEFGGDIPMADMINVWKMQLAEKRERILALDKMKLLDNTCLMKKNRVVQDAGSFRKLAID